MTSPWGPGTPDNCNTGRVGLKKFLYSDATGEYVLLGDASEEEEKEHGGVRHLRQGPWDSPEISDVTNPIVPSIPRNSERFLHQRDDGNVVFARQCFCAEMETDIYCPVGTELCRLLSPTRVQCEGPVQGLMGRFLLPLILFVYVFFGCLLVVSPQGKYARGHLKKVACCWTEERYHDELRDQARRLMSTRRRTTSMRNPHRIYYTNERDVVARTLSSRGSSRETTPVPTTVRTAPLRPELIPVRLRTRTYAGHTVTECTICLGEFRAGDRVGDLSCGHVFHVDPCLKKWIVRRNHCPLCQARLVTEGATTMESTATTNVTEDEPVNIPTAQNEVTQSARRDADAATDQLDASMEQARTLPS